ncbi:hypothetical protein BGX27_003755, partial [Mortierella sp. AM989]
MDDIFDGLELLRNIRGINQEVRTFYSNLLEFYQSTPEGKRHMELLLLEWRRTQEQAKFNTASEGSLFREGSGRAGNIDITDIPASSSSSSSIPTTSEIHSPNNTQEVQKLLSTISELLEPTSGTSKAIHMGQEVE